MSGTLNKFITTVEELVMELIKIDTGVRTTIQITMDFIFMINQKILKRWFVDNTLPTITTRFF